MLLPATAGVALAAGLAVFARVTRFERDASFYPTVLIVIAGYYVLFAAIAGQGVALELALAMPFIAVALLGARRGLAVTAAGLIAHGLFDLLHPYAVDNPGVPGWWPPFCAAVDMALGGWLLWQARTRTDTP